MSNIKPNCGPASVAKILNLPVGEIENLFRETFEMASNWQGRSTVFECVCILNSLASASPCGDKPTGKVEGKGSVAGFVRNHTTQTGTYFIRVGGHFMAIKNRLIYDNHFDGADPDTCKWKRKRVSHAFKINTH